MRFSGQRLKDQREAAGVRVERVAADIDRSYLSVRNYEAGVTTPHESIVNAMASTIGCSPFAFYEADPGELAQVAS